MSGVEKHSRVYAEALMEEIMSEARQFDVTFTFSDWTGVGAHPPGDPIDPDVFAETLFELLQSGLEELGMFNFSVDTWSTEVGDADAGR